MRFFLIFNLLRRMTGEIGACPFMKHYNWMLRYRWCSV